MIDQNHIVLEDDHLYFSVTPPGGLSEHGAACCLELGWKDPEDEDEETATLLPVSEAGVRNLIAHLERYLPNGDGGASQH